MRTRVNKVHSRIHGANEGDASTEALVRSHAVPRYCYRCGTPWDESEICCPSCGGTDPSYGSARPTYTVGDEAQRFDGPWQMLPWIPTGSVAMFGGPGAGKSSLAAMIRPRMWITKEQEPRPVGNMFRRLIADYMPDVRVADSAEDVATALSECERGPVVLDSLTAFGLKDALVSAHMLVEWARRHNDRALAIVQVNKDGQLAGYMEIPHLFDAVVNVTPDPWGVRSFRVTKSRWSSLGAVYWSFDKDGKIQIPSFNAAYSVEGEPGEYWLHPYPLKGAKWSGMLNALAEAGTLRPGCACAATEASYLATGFLEPMDATERRAFAERNGLVWLDPATTIIPSKD